MFATLPPARLKSMSRLCHSMREANLTRHITQRRLAAAGHIACLSARADASPALPLALMTRSHRVCPSGQARIPFSSR